MHDSIRQQVLARAGDRCEYCRMPQQFDELIFEIEHVIARQHGGSDRLVNRAAACFACNRHKGPNLAGVDPKSGKKVWLFNPRRHTWLRHFRWNGPILVGRTPIGRATIVVLAINRPLRVRHRDQIMREGVFDIT